MMRYEIRQEQIHGLREALGFHWVDIARMLVLNITRKVHWYSSRCPRTAAKPLKKSFALGIKETLLNAIVHSNLWAGFQSLSETELIKNSCLSSWFKNIHFGLENASLDTIELKLNPTILIYSKFKLILIVWTLKVNLWIWIIKLRLWFFVTFGIAYSWQETAGNWN